MTISARSIALQGLGFSVLAVALHGFAPALDTGGGLMGGGGKPPVQRRHDQHAKAPPKVALPIAFKGDPQAWAKFIAQVLPSEDHPADIAAGQSAIAPIAKPARAISPASLADAAPEPKQQQSNWQYAITPLDKLAIEKIAIQQASQPTQPDLSHGTQTPQAQQATPQRQATIASDPNQHDAIAIARDDEALALILILLEATA